MADHLFRQAPKRRDWPLIVRGAGALVFDAEGRSIVDGASGGVCVVNVGHGVREIPDAMAEQAKKIAFAFAGAVDNPAERELAGRLAALAPGALNRVFFLNTGSEATETAVKLARHYFLETGKPEKHKVIGRLHSYHGSSFGALSYGGRMDRRKAYGPYLWDHPKIEPCYCYRCPFGKVPETCDVPCADDLDRAIREAGPETVAAFVAEPVVSTPIAGAAPPPDYFPRIREICDAHDVMFIADEVVTGFGRTGRMFGLDHWNVAPDFLCIGKGMSGGYAPLAATIVHEKVFEAIAGGSGVAPIGFSYGGNPVSCAAGLAALDYIEAHDLVARAARMGEVFGACPGGAARPSPGRRPARHGPVARGRDRRRQGEQVALSAQPARSRNRLRLRHGRGRLDPAGLRRGAGGPGRLARPRPTLRHFGGRDRSVGRRHPHGSRPLRRGGQGGGLTALRKTEPLTLPSLRDGSLPLPMGEGYREVAQQTLSHREGVARRRRAE